MGLAQEEGPGSAELPVPRGDRQPWPSEVAVPPRAAVQGEALEPDCQFQILEPPPTNPPVFSQKSCVTSVSLPLVLCERGTAVVFAPRLVRGSGALNTQGAGRCRRWGVVVISMVGSKGAFRNED